MPHATNQNGHIFVWQHRASVRRSKQPQVRHGHFVSHFLFGMWISPTSLYIPAKSFFFGFDLHETTLQRKKLKKKLVLCLNAVFGKTTASVAQSVERCPFKALVAGSKPAEGLFFFKKDSHRRKTSDACARISMVVNDSPGVCAKPNFVR